MIDASRLSLTHLVRPDQTFNYVHIPFEVPPGIGRIDVSYQYESAVSSDPTVQSGNTIGIGIIDPRGTQFMTQGFRGWSGSARKQFYISTRSATPGYMPGPISPGIWNICLGAYKVAPEGCECHLEITLTTAQPGEAEAEFSHLLTVGTRSTHKPTSDHWYKGEIHCHTVHSDGDSTIDEVLQIAHESELDFLAITDHNNRSHLAELAT